MEHLTHQQSQINQIISDAQDIVIIQADNPDGDSLASALALEQILGDQGKQIHLYCGVSMPSYLRHLAGWDRVSDLLPVKFDVSIIVDTSAVNLLEQLQKSQSLGWLKSKPCIVLDHHVEAEPTIDFAEVTYIQSGVATGEVIYNLAKQLNWSVNLQAAQMLTAAIMSDSLGLTSEGTSANSIRVIADLVELGVSIPELENKRREMSVKSPHILAYKGRLIERIEYSDDQQIATVTIPWEEIEKYSPEYNPSMLVLDEMRLVKDVKLAVAFKTYPDNRITAKLRANYGYGIASQVAAHFGGGGHPYAAGFKITDGKPLNQIRSECIQKAQALLATMNDNNTDTGDTDDQTPQYAYSVG